VAQKPLLARQNEHVIYSHELFVLTEEALKLRSFQFVVRHTFPCFKVDCCLSIDVNILGHQLLSKIRAQPKMLVTCIGVFLACQ